MPDDILITTVRNPFDPRAESDTVPRSLPAGSTVADVMRQSVPGPIQLDHLAVVVNKVACPDPAAVVVQPGDRIAIYPRIAGGLLGDNPLQTIASLGVILVAAMVAGPLLGPGGTIFGLSAEASKMFVFSAISSIGMTAVNSMFPAARPDFALPQISGISGGSFEGAPAYGWGGPQSSWETGLPLQVLYGQLLLPGQIINYYPETNNYTNAQTAHILLSMCQGQVSNPVASADDVKINNSIILSTLESYSKAYTTGEVSPSVLSGFEKLHQYRELAIEVATRVVLLLHLDASPFVDASPSAKTVTNNGVSLDTTTKKFGAGSGSFVYTASDYLSLADSNDWYLADQNWTITTQFYYQGTNTYYPLCGQGSGNPRWALYWNRVDGYLTLLLTDSTGTTTSVTSSATGITASTWHHIEVNRYNDRIGFFVDGFQRGSATVEVEVPDVAGALRVGSCYVGGAWQYFNGNLDEFLILKGRCIRQPDVYSDTSVPTAAYDDEFDHIVTARGKADELTVFLEWPYGLYEINTSSQLIDHTVQLAIHHRQNGGATWYLRRGTFGFTSGSAQPGIGDKLQGATSGVTGYVVSIDLASGTWGGGTAAGDFVLSNVSGSFTLGEQLDNVTTSSSNIANVSSSASDLDYFEEVATNKNTPVRRQFDFEGETGRQTYDVKVARISADPAVTTKKDTFFWVGLDELIDEELVYPYMSLFALHVEATEQLNGRVQSVAAVWDRGNITVPNFSGVGTVSRDSSNPAWAAFDLLTNERYGAGIPATRIDETSWTAWANWCAGTVDGNPRIEIGGVFDGVMGIWQALEHICQIGRATILQVGRNLRVAVEKPSDPVPLFSDGNNREETFNLEFIRKDDRPDIYEIEFINSGRDWQRDKVRIVSALYNPSTEVPKIEKLFLWGCTSEDVARRYGLLRMQMNDKLNRLINVEEDVDAINCQVGDVVVAQSGSNKLTFGGRLGTQTGGGPWTTVTIDQEINLASATFSGNCTLWIRQNDDTLLERTVTGPFDTDTDTINISASVSGIAAGDVWMIGRASGDVHEYRITAIERSEDSNMQISALEYNPDVYFHSDFAAGATEI